MLYPCLTLHRIAILIKEFQGCLSCAGCSREVSRPPVPGPALPSIVAPSLILQVSCTVSNPIGAFRPRAGHQTLSSGKAPESPGSASCQSGEEAVLCAPEGLLHSRASTHSWYFPQLLPSHIEELNTNHNQSVPGSLLETQLFILGPPESRARFLWHVWELLIGMWFWGHSENVG